MFFKTESVCVVLAGLELTVYVDQAGLELTEYCLPLPPECWNLRLVSPHPAAGALLQIDFQSSRGCSAQGWYSRLMGRRAPEGLFLFCL